MTPAELAAIRKRDAMSGTSIRGLAGPRQAPQRDRRALLAALDALTKEKFAEMLTRIRGAHNNADYETEEGEPCDWCRLAGEQAAQAVRQIIGAQP